MELRGGCMLEKMKAFLPALLGLTCSRTGFIAVTYGSYASTDENVLTDGTTLVTLGVLFIALVALAAFKKHLSDRTVKALCLVTIAIQGLSAFGIAYLTIASPDWFEGIFALSIAATLSGSLSIFYWLRSMSSSTASEAALFAFAALAVSEVLLYVIVSAPNEVEKILAGVIALCQFACLKQQKRSTSQPPEQEPAEQRELLYHGFGSPTVNKTGYLIAMSFGIGSLSLVIGVLRGYPDGTAIAFTPTTRLAYGLLAITLSLVILKLIAEGRQSIVSIGIFTIMEALACLALILYGAFPGALSIGAVATTTLNALMVGFTWYIIIVFMAHGWRDPYYYAFGGWIVWLGCRAVARMALLELHYISANDLLVTAMLGALIVFSTQVVLIRLLAVSNEAVDIPSETGEEQKAEAEVPKASVIKRIMGLDDGPTPEKPLSLSDMREQTMHRCAEEMGRQFLLSAREVDVLSLYALGYTQKRVAEELFISQSTAHAHIKRIYAKTDMHSRQELIDYLNQYTS